MFCTELLLLCPSLCILLSSFPLLSSPLLPSPLPHRLFFLPSRLTVCPLSSPFSFFLSLHPLLLSLPSLSPLSPSFSPSPQLPALSLRLPPSSPSHSHSLVLGVAAAWLPASASTASPCQLVNAATGAAVPCREPVCVCVCVCVCVWVYECTQMGKQLSQGGLPLISSLLSPSFTLPPLFLCCHGAPAGWITTASAERAEVKLCVCRTGLSFSI